ncbi:MAG: flagellar biosynthetic protein FliO [Deltaproteobacteria bacterium]|jgi:flagellar biosynthetic protein FliO|nr:flagellar biosynthetic protein FliO [Deltaproteobacteria bacterium]
MGAVDFFSSLVKMISALAVVLGIMIAAMYFVKKFMKGTASGIDDGKFIKIISTRYIGPKCSIMLIDVLSSIIVISMANNQITMLTTISDPKSLERLKDFDRDKKNPVSLFDNLSSYRSKLLAPRQTRRGSRENE